MSRMTMKLRRPLDETLKKKIEPYTFQVGILKDAAHRKAAPLSKGMNSYANTPVRKKSKRKDGTLSLISAKARAALGINYLTRPFQNRNDDAVRMLNGFWKLVFGHNVVTLQKRTENLIQACVRNPLLRGSYGSNSKVTQKIKGSKKKFIDTAQLFQGIKARIIVKR